MDPCELTSLSRHQKRQREPLAALPGGVTVAGSTSTATPTPEGDGGGIDSPLTEQQYQGAVYYQLVSSDGLFVFEFAEETEYKDAANRSVVVKHLAP